MERLPRPSPRFYFLIFLILLQLHEVLSQESEPLEIRVSPTSILVPTNTSNVDFECIAHCMEACSIIWFIDDIPTEHQHQRDRFMEKGYSFSYTPDPLNNVYSSRLSVTASARVNNTRYRCEAESDSDYTMSSTAVLLVISEPAVSPNPFVETLPTSFKLKWSPPYLWTGHRISYYNVSIANSIGGTVSYNRINAMFNDSIVTYNISGQDLECTELIFGISAVSTTGEVLQTYDLLMGGYHQEAPMDFDISALSITVLFFANITPIIRMKIKLPSMICDHQEVNYTIIVDTINDTNIIELGPFYHLGSGMVQHDLVSSRLVRDEEYSVIVILFTYSHTVISRNHSFNTTFMAQIDSIPPVCTDAVSNHDHGIQNYNLVLGICVTFAILSFAILVIFIGAFLMWKIHQRRKTMDTSAERVCNAMVPNPIYSGPLYESVQPRFETLTSITASSQQCNSQASTPSSSEKSVRYVDPPSHSPKNRSKSFAFSGPSPSPMPTSDASNIARSTSVSIPAMKKSTSGKQRNKLNLTLTLTGTDSTDAHSAQNSTAEPISAVNPIVLRVVDDNYTVMNPVAGHRVLAGMAEWSELSPEDIDKYKE